MRFYKYLCEQNNSSIINLIKRDCKKFLSESKGQRLWRGIPRGLKGDWEHFDKPGLRDSRGMTKAVAEAVNTWLKSKGFVPRDRAVFTIGDASAAGEFGTPFCFFPIGQYNFTYVKTHDINGGFEDYSGSQFERCFLIWYLKDYLREQVAKNYEISVMRGKWMDKLGITVMDLVTNDKLKFDIIYGNDSKWDNADIRVDSTTYPKIEWIKRSKDYGPRYINNKNLSEAIKNKWEIWFDSPYYLVHPELIKDL